MALSTQPSSLAITPALSSPLYQATLPLLRLFNNAIFFLYLREYILTQLRYAFPILSSSILYTTTLLPLLISNAIRVPALQLCILSEVLLIQTYYATSTLAWKSFDASLEVARQGWRLTSKAAKLGYKSTEGIRKKLFLEFAVFILGSGNGMFLVLFWPGWWVIGGLFWVGWWIATS